MRTAKIATIQNQNNNSQTRTVASFQKPTITLEDRQKYSGMNVYMAKAIDEFSKKLKDATPDMKKEAQKKAIQTPGYTSLSPEDAKKLEKEIFDGLVKDMVDKWKGGLLKSGIGNAKELQDTMKKMLSRSMVNKMIYQTILKGSPDLWADGDSWYKAGSSKQIMASLSGAFAEHFTRSSQKMMMYSKLCGKDTAPQGPPSIHPKLQTYANKEVKDIKVKDRLEKAGHLQSFKLSNQLAGNLRIAGKIR